MNALPQTDQLRRFVFDNLDVRGCIVQLKESCEAIQSTHHYPPSLAGLLNQFALAACLLRDSIKINGDVTIQLRGAGAIDLIMADCLADRRVRAIAEYDNEALAVTEQLDLQSLGSGATLAITITPEDGERYQGIVPIEHASLEECLQDYFARSEQLPSLFRLLANQGQGVGIALHSLPAQEILDKAETTENFQRLGVLLKTMQTEEALALDSDELLTRLFHAEECRLFDPSKVEFGCPCSAQKSLNAIASLGKTEVNAIILEQRAEGKNNLVVDCHFCFQRYEFDLAQLEEMIV